MRILHARTFVFALYHFGNALKFLAKQPGAPSALAKIRSDFQCQLPGLKAVRDSAQHRDERLRWIAQRMPIIPKAVETGLIFAPAGAAMVIDMLSGNCLTSTGADGITVGVDVSAVTLGRLVTAAQDVMDAYEWRGSPREIAV